jgi:hypothetical protein
MDAVEASLQTQAVTAAADLDSSKTWFCGLKNNQSGLTQKRA